MLPGYIAEGLEISREASDIDIAGRLAEIGGFRPPTRPETVAYLLEFVAAVEQSPPEWGAYEDAHFAHSHMGPHTRLLHDIPTLLICAWDLGALEQRPLKASSVLGVVLASFDEATRKVLIAFGDRIIGPYREHRERARRSSG